MNCKDLVTSIKQQGNLAKRQFPAILDREHQLSVWREWASYGECLTDAIRFNQQRKIDRFLNKENVVEITELKAALFPNRWRYFTNEEKDENSIQISI